MNNKNKIPKLDFTKEEDFLKTFYNPYFTKIYETNLLGQGLIHNGHSACEYNEVFCQQNFIVVHLKPEQNSLRRMGDRVEVENVNVGDVAIIPANVNHWQRIETEVAEGVVLTIEPNIIADIAFETVNPDKVELLPTFAKPDPLIQHLALNIKANLDSDSYDRLYSESLYRALSLHLLRNYSTRQFVLNELGGLPRYKLKQAIDYINDNLDEKINIYDIAKLVDISNYYFCRMFHASTGISPYQYVLRQRVAKTKELLENSKLPLADIAYECGFSSQSQMTQHFRKQVGVTPKVYRNRL